jgi:hypothetical protein
MHSFDYRYPAGPIGAIVLMLLSAGAQAEELFAPNVFTSTPQLSEPYTQGTGNNLHKAALQQPIKGQKPPAANPASQWISAPTATSKSAVPLPPRLRF